MTGVLDRARDEARKALGRGLIDRIWDRDPRAWDPPGDPPDALEAGHRSIASRLGWLDAPREMRRHLAPVGDFAAEARQSGITSGYLLGMGGSSLCAEILRDLTSGRPPDVAISVLDTTDPQAVRGAAAETDPERTLFLVSSKSGTTIEVDALEAFFRQTLETGGRTQAVGRQFTAITDPGTPLESLARQAGYRQVFLNPSDIGGRFSVLSLFGLVPAALLGVDTERLLAAAASMAGQCRQGRLDNPGLELGAILAAAARAGRDKLTLLLPGSIASFGLWIEQLVAESTGKRGLGILPIVGEPMGSPADYGSDRLFVVIDTDGDAIDPRFVAALEQAGQPVHRLSTRLADMGGEFFRWEFAVAVAGALLGLNPFDEPNVKETKDRTARVLAAPAMGGPLGQDTRRATDGVSAAGSPDLQRDTPAETLSAALGSLRPGDYLALLTYLPTTPDPLPVLQRLRESVRQRYGISTTVGIGPRYLHSTGQYHKGGPNTGVALILTAADEIDVPIPGRAYSFGVLRQAQALGDFEALVSRGRRVVHLHFDRADRAAATRLAMMIEEAVRTVI